MTQRTLAGIDNADALAYGPPVDRSPQGVFDKVVAHMLTQGERCEGEDGCAYRAGVRACGVGCLVSDGLAAQWDRVEDGHIAMLDDDGHVPRWLKPSVRMLVAVQAAHDRGPVDRWAASLAEIADLFDLEFNPPAAVEAADV